MLLKGVRKKLLWTAGVLGTAYGSYRFYHSSYAAEKMRQISNFYAALSSIFDAVSSASSISARVIKELEEYLHSDSDEIPQSVRQVLKLSESSEFQSFVSSTSLSISRGVIGSAMEIIPSDVSHGRLPTISMDPVLDRLFSDAGRSFASVVVGSAVRNLTREYCEQVNRRQQSMAAASAAARVSRYQTEQAAQKWMKFFVDASSTPNGRKLVSLMVSTFTVQAVRTFLEETGDVNVFEDIIGTVTKPEYRQPVTDMLKSVCGEAVESAVRTSHDVLSTETGQISPLPSHLHSQAQRANIDPDVVSLVGGTSNRGLIRGGPVNRRDGWQREVGKLLAVPEARQMLIDVSGAVTVHGMKTFMSTCFGIIGGSSQEVGGPSGSSGSGQGANVAIRSLKRVANRALTASSITLALCLHYLTGMDTMRPRG